VYDLFRSTVSDEPAATLLLDYTELEANDGRSKGDTLLRPTGGVSSLTFHPRNRRLLAIGYTSGEVVLWRLPRRVAQPVKGEAQALEAFLSLALSEK